MTRYTVVWVRSVHDELAEIWQQAGDRDAVTTAADAIDEVLSVDALDRGGELSEGLRCLILPPLKVIYAVTEEDRLVQVLRVRRI